MKNIENMNALGDMEMAEVAGGMIWPGIPPLDPFNPLNENRPLPFPQDRRGNKAPLDMKRDGTWEYVCFDSWKWENLR